MGYNPSTDGSTLEAIEAALKHDPGDDHARFARAEALLALGRIAEAIGDYSLLLGRHPRNAELWYMCGAAEMAIGRNQGALQSFTAALGLKPDYFEALVRRGNVLLFARNYEAALADYGAALALEPNSAGVLYNRGTVLKELKRHGKALADYQRAMTLEPGLPHLEGALLHAHMQVCDWRDFAGCSAAVLAHLPARAAMPFTILPLPSTPAQQLACARLYTGAKFPPAPRPLWNGERYNHDRIRIAYLSGAFTEHPVALALASVLAAHDRSRFEIIGISFRPGDGGAARRRLVSAFDRFFDMADKDEQQTAELVRELEVDVAVDLDGLTDTSRTGVVARRCAPVQVNWLGYPSTMGADYVDYIIADAIVAADDSGFAEKVARLPDTFFPAEAREELTPPPSRAACGLPETGLVFCAFNNNYKITPDVFDIWMRLLKAVDGSVLWLRQMNDTVRGNLAREAAARGVDASRLIFAPMLNARANHLARQQLADIFLDTLYYNAHSTACDALWAGTPIVTWRGPAFAGRVAASLLHAIGLDDLVAESLEGYEAIALKLARDPAHLAELRARLARNRLTRPLFDVTRFTRNLERAYEAMHTRATPESFTLPPTSPTDPAAPSRP